MMLDNLKQYIKAFILIVIAIHQGTDLFFYSSIKLFSNYHY